MKNIERMKEHYWDIQNMWRKTQRVCGIGSKPESAMFEIFIKTGKELQQAMLEAEAEEQERLIEERNQALKNFLSEGLPTDQDSAEKKG